MATVCKAPPCLLRKAASLFGRLVQLRVGIGKLLAADEEFEALARAGRGDRGFGERTEALGVPDQKRGLQRRERESRWWSLIAFDRDKAAYMSESENNWETGSSRRVGMIYKKIHTRERASK
jgi:hypothetical protein